MTATRSSRSSRPRHTRRSSRYTNSDNPIRKNAKDWTVVDDCDGEDAKGLFAKRLIPKGAVVAEIANPRRVKESENLFSWHQKSEIGGDAAITVNRVVYTGPGFGKRNKNGYVKAPKWYRMNHSHNPNCILKYIANKLEWHALRDIEKDEALTWNYGEADSSWSRNDDFCSTRRRR